MTSADSIGRALGVGTLVDGRFRIERELGRGAMAAVYKVRDQRTGHELALKLLLVDEPEPQALAVSLFEREFHVLAQLAHPLIIEVHDYGKHASFVYYTMELLDGEDLDAKGKQPYRQACAVLRDVASSLAIVHSRKLVHRDVSARNVRCTASGRAKLIDFGAMVPMGVVHHVVGTPPFLAPEAMQQQPLDARSDLFALGGLAYFMLTGRHAYGARSMAALRDIWRTPPAAPARLEPSVPRALSELVMELLQLDPNARPSSAAVVIERLCAIAGLPMEEHRDVRTAYLVSPRLVGRDQLLAAVRERLEALHDSRSAVIFAEGRAGSGRSRFLDACVLQARLSGCIVLRADRSDAGRGEYGIARTLARQLFAASKRAEQQACADAVLLDALIRSDGRIEASDDALHAAFCDWVLEVGRDQALTIAIDDLELADERSLRLLATLAHSDRRRIALICGVDREQHEPDRVLHLRSAATHIGIEPLSSLETEALVRSLFGNAAHVVTTAGRIHERSQGYPREAMKLAQYLVEHGLARYEAGGWLLPPELEDRDLPASFHDAMVAKLAQLGPSARELAQMLALSDPEIFSLQEYPALADSRDHAAIYRAIDELVVASVLSPVGDRYRFAQSGLRALIVETLPAERASVLHARLACIAEDAGDPFRLPHHLLESGQAEQAIERLLQRRNDRRFELSPATLDLVQRALERARALQLPAYNELELQAWLVSIASVIGDSALFDAHAPAVLARLTHDSGLSDYHALPDTLPSDERLRQALRGAQQRYEATPEAERGLSPADSIHRLGRVCVDHVAIAGVVSDLGLIERAPDIAPFVPLSPVLWVVQTMSAGMKCFQQARYRLARGHYLRALERIDAQDRLGVAESFHQSLRLGVLYVIALIEAGFGIPSAPERLAELETAPGYRVNGLRAHMAFALNEGDIGQAREYERRADLMQLKDGPKQIFPLTSARLELTAYSAADDLMGVKQCVERLQAIAERHPSWSGFAALARVQYRRLQGDFEGAMTGLTELLSIAPLSEQTWPWIARSHVQLLLGLERPAEAAQVGVAYMQTALAAEIAPSHRLIATATIEALALAGRCEEAIALAEQHIAEIEAEGVRGLHRGALYEARAKAAIAAGDHPGFEHWAARCSIEYRLGRNPALVAKYERLMQLAERYGYAASPATCAGELHTTECGLAAEAAAMVSTQQDLGHRRSR